MSEPVVIDLSEADDVALAGGKAATLARLRRSGLPIPPGGVVVTTSAYRAFLAHRGLGERIALELVRRPLAELRAEETWDIALRVRALMLAAEWPEALRRELAEGLESVVEAGSLAVRSSAPHEDAETASFAGLHESVIGVEVLLAVSLVVALSGCSAQPATGPAQGEKPATGTESSNAATLSKSTLNFWPQNLEVGKEYQVSDTEQFTTVATVLARNTATVPAGTIEDAYLVRFRSRLATSGKVIDNYYLMAGGAGLVAWLSDLTGSEDAGFTFAKNIVLLASLPTK